MTEQQSADMPIVDADALVDGDPQTYERFAAIHDGARSATSAHGVELTRFRTPPRRSPTRWVRAGR
jgi:hypothetical protein